MDLPGIGAGLGATLAGVGAFVLQLIVFLVILLIGWLIAKGVVKALTFLLNKIGFQRVLDRSGLTKLLAPTGISPIDLLLKLIYYFILLITLQLALGAFGQDNPVSQIVNDIVAFIPSALVAVVIVIVVSAIANVVGDLLRPVLSRFSFGPLLTRIVVIAIIALGVIAALNQIGVAVTVTMPILIAVLAAIVGVVVVGVGGGLIKPMQSRWEGWLGALSHEAAKAPAPAAATRATTPGAAAPTAGAPAPGAPSDPPTAPTRPNPAAHDVPPVPPVPPTPPLTRPGETPPA
jgi:hypothetical protein